MILGAITLDLFAVLFGGSVALLPLFAKSILHTGPFGLGVLRSMVAVGALLAGIRLARKPLRRHAGRTLLLVVGLFGASMVVFGLSRWFWLSALALAVSGFVDMFSMNIRQTTVTFATPNEVLGRVTAVEGVFIGASNELGAFESGAAAALLGAVPAVVVGGLLHDRARARLAEGVPRALARRRAVSRPSSKSAASRGSRSSGRPRASRLTRTRARARRRRPPFPAGSASGSRTRLPAGGRTRPPSRYGFSTVLTSIASP